MVGLYRGLLSLDECILSKILFEYQECANTEKAGEKKETKFDGDPEALSGL